MFIVILHLLYIILYVHVTTNITHYHEKNNFVEALNSANLSYLSTSSEALQVATFIHKMAKRQTTRFAGHLQIGPQLKIPCKMFTQVRIGT